ncbi:MAG: hypothetical protein K2L72_01065 [Clostridia bacterium]|nr:hypothetical protein [Clostridia bacterium]
MLSADGYVKGEIDDFSQYVGTDAYRTVANSGELIDAIMDAKYSYTSAWDNETESVVQSLIKKGSVHVIEITQDIDMAYNKLDPAYVPANGNGSYIENYSRRNAGSI